MTTRGHCLAQLGSSPRKPVSLTLTRTRAATSRAHCASIARGTWAGSFRGKAALYAEEYGWTTENEAVGKRLVDECIRFSRTAGYQKITLWTQANLLAARHLYKTAGFTCVVQEPHHRFGKDLVAETWELAL